MSKKKLIRVVGTNLDNGRLVLYTETGGIEYVPQGHPKLAAIITQVTQDINSKGVSEIEFSSSYNDVPDAYKLLEEQSKGAIEFFETSAAFMKEAVDVMKALKEVLAGTIKLPELDINEEKVVHAVVDKKDIVANVSKIEETIVNAVANENTLGVTNLIKRMANVDMEHTAQDLLDFLNTAKLPITNCGNIIFFKSVNVVGEDYVDCHTGIIKQKPGTLVYMDQSLVDPDRKNECSNGLHIASVEYASRFYGSALLVGIVRPEDVIAVPLYDATKVRVKSYQVVMAVDSENRNIIRTDRSIEGTSSEFKKSIQGLVEDKYDEPKTFSHIISNSPLEVEYETTASKNIKEEVISAKEEVKVNKPVEEIQIVKNTITPKKASKGITQKEKLIQLVELFIKEKKPSNKRALACQIMDIKRKQKNGWRYYKVSKSVGQSITEYIK